LKANGRPEFFLSTSLHVFSTSNISVFYDKPKKHLEKVVIEDFTTQRVVRFKPNLAGIK